MTRCLTLMMLCLRALPIYSQTVVASGDAAITRDDAGIWSLTAAGATLQLRLKASVDFAVLRLTSPSGQEWMHGAASDTSLTVNGKTLVFGSAASGFVFDTADAVADGPRLHLTAVFDSRAAGTARHPALRGDCRLPDI